ncbi:MAG: hypothetical protein ACOYOT_04310 [Bacteroidales bacterium]
MNLKQLLCFGLISLMASYAALSQDNTCKKTCETVRLKGNVHKVEETTTNLLQPKPSMAKKERSVAVRYFNRSGWLEREIDYVSNRKCGERTAKYNEKGYKTEESEYAEGEVVGRCRYHYDTQGQLMREEEWTKRENPTIHSLRKLRYTYCHTPDSTIIYCFDSSGALRNKSISIHSLHRTIEFLYQTDDSLFTRTEFNNNANGKLAKASFYDAHGRLSHQKFYQYDSLNMLLTSEKRIEIQNEIPISTTNIRYAYDAKCNLTEIAESNLQSGITVSFTYRYTYDKAGNWITSIEKRNDKPVRLVTRKIQYYRSSK